MYSTSPNPHQAKINHYLDFLTDDINKSSLIVGTIANRISFPSEGFLLGTMIRVVDDELDKKGIYKMAIEMKNDKAKSTAEKISETFDIYYV